MAVFKTYFKRLLNSTKLPAGIQKIKFEFLLGWLIGPLIVLLVAIGLFFQYYQNRYYQGVIVGTVSLGGLTRSQATQKINAARLDYQPAVTLTVKFPQLNREFSIPNFQLKSNLDETLDEAWLIGHHSQPGENLRQIWSLINQPTVLPIYYRADQLGLTNFLTDIKTQLDFAGATPSATLATSGDPASLTINPGQDGWQLDLLTSQQLINEQLLALSPIDLLVAQEAPKVNKTLETVSPTKDNQTQNSTSSAINLAPPAILNSEVSSPENGLAESPDKPFNLTIDLSSAIIPQQQKLTPAQIDQTKTRLTGLVGRSLTFTTKNLVDQSDQNLTTRIITDQELINLVTLPVGYQTTKIAQLIAGWAKEIDRPPQDAQLEINPDQTRVTKFVEPKAGLVIDQAEATKKIISFLQAVDRQHGFSTDLTADFINPGQYQTTSNHPTPHQSTSPEPSSPAGLLNSLNQLDQQPTFDLDQLATKAELLITSQEPAITLAKTNQLGINELIGYGESYYAHSIASRIHNVKITSDRLNYAVVAPGQEFSFNQTIGEVSAATGYQAAYIIKSGQTLLSEGGGVCQVSTTLFRALLDAGVDITRRLPHSYRVSYYELDRQPGFDATVYSGNVDLRFVNDTPGHLLIVSQADSDRVYMQVKIYGTNDGRQSTISNYKQWGYQPPLATVYIPDASLPTGKLRQIDWSASGIKASFDWTVTDKNGQVIHQKNYYSYYRPWAAKYLKGI